MNEVPSSVPENLRTRRRADWGRTANTHIHLRSGFNERKEGKGAQSPRTHKKGGESLGHCCLLFSKAGAQVLLYDLG